MPVYRFYPLGRDRRIAGPPVEVDAAGDDAALAQREALPLPISYEVWEGAKLIGVIFGKSVSAHPGASATAGA